jgi:hypothetical protein
MKSSLLLAVLTAFALSVLVVPRSAAQDLGFKSWGLRGGISIDPDQFTAGVFFNAGHFSRKVRFQPSFDLGFGNGVRLGTLNLDAFYIFSPRPWRPYAGGGLGINFIDVTEGVGQGRGLDVEAALNIAGGIEWGRLRTGFRRYLIEARLGLGDTPDLKLTAGIAF